MNGAGEKVTSSAASHTSAQDKQKRGKKKKFIQNIEGIDFSFNLKLVFFFV